MRRGVRERPLSPRMPHLERFFVTAIVVLVGILLGLSLFYTGEVARTAKAPDAYVRGDGRVPLEAPAWDVTRPLPDPRTLSPGEEPLGAGVPVAVSPDEPPSGPASDSGALAPGTLARVTAAADGPRTYLVRA